MPSGRTHDLITLYSLPVVTLLSGMLAQSSSVALAVGGAFLFAGLMFSGDLDTRSHQYNRWLWLRWIWLPYRRLCKHRSMWSHGPILGTCGRVLYLIIWIAIPAAAAVYVGHLYADWPWQPAFWLRQSLAWLSHPTGKLNIPHGGIVLAALVGLELGAMSHSLSDWIGSGIKRRVNSRRRTKM